jgi:hypothetical protein
MEMPGIRGRTVRPEGRDLAGGGVGGVPTEGDGAGVGAVSLRTGRVSSSRFALTQAELRSTLPPGRLCGAGGLWW